MPSATVNTLAAASVTESTTGDSVRSRSAGSVTAWWTLTTSSARSFPASIVTPVTVTEALNGRPGVTA